MTTREDMFKVAVQAGIDNWWNTANASVESYHAALEQIIATDTAWYESREQELESLRQQVAERDACIQVMREALENYIVDHPDKPFVTLAAWRVKEALSTTPSPELLIEFADRVREEIAEYVDRNLFGCREYADAIRSMKGKLP